MNDLKLLELLRTQRDNLNVTIATIEHTLHPDREAKGKHIAHQAHAFVAHQHAAPRSAHPRGVIQSKLEEVLTDTPQKLPALAKAIDRKPSSVSSALFSLKTKGKVKKTKDGWKRP